MIENAFIIAFIVYFIKVTTWPGMIFEKVGDWTERVLGEHWNKPVLGCPICMTPWWGTAIYYLADLLDIPNFSNGYFPLVLMTVFAAAGINSVILMFNKLYDEAKDEEKLIEKQLDESNNKKSNKG